MKNLTLIIPAKEEAESLPTVLKEIENLECHIIVILHDSDLATINAIKNFNCEIVYQKNTYNFLLRVLEVLYYNHLMLF